MILVVILTSAKDMPAKASQKTWRCLMRSFLPQAALGKFFYHGFLGRT